jgi:hypothetical protein
LPRSDRGRWKTQETRYKEQGTIENTFNTETEHDVPKDGGILRRFRVNDGTSIAGGEKGIMSKTNLNNPDNSKLVQIFLDIEAVLGHGIPEDFRREALARKNEIESKINSHEYPSEALVFTRYSRENSVAENLQKIEKRGVFAVLLLDLIVKNIPQNLNFSIAVKDVMAIMGWSKSTALRAFKILTDYGIIAVVRQGKGRGNPTIYMLNPMVADVGKKKPPQVQEEFWTLAGDWEARKYIGVAEKCVTVDEVKTEDKLKYSMFKYKEKSEEQQEEEEPTEETEMTKKSIKKVESIQPLTAQQREEIDTTFSIRQ